MATEAFLLVGMEQCKVGIQLYLVVMYLTAEEVVLTMVEDMERFLTKGMALEWLVLGTKLCLLQFFKSRLWVSRQSFNLEVDARNYGFEPTETPRTDRSVSKNIELGLAALRGEKGAAYDRIVLSAGIVDHILGCEGAEDVAVAMDRAKEAIDSGKALKKLLNYIEISRKIK
ncbi:hypothetical protein Bca4012_009539 [Brassica carinata]|uniref:Anthranilate phosphoribosyltransferase n=1 Tax=Brassica carinata TaxID=52824 RepID=A0A8X7UZX7_BRACI|nr:hypothetical protein Bca52824_034807 [Brassica carinata]